MSEHFDITIWRLVGTFDNSNVMREELIVQAVGGEYLGLRTSFRSVRPVAYGWVFRFIDQAAVDAFVTAVESHELPPEESGERKPRQPHEDDDVEMIRPNGELVMVKRARIENLLKKGWTLPGESGNSGLASDSPVEKLKKEKKEKKKKVNEKQAAEPVKIHEPFVAKPDDWVVMMSASTKELIRCKRHRVPYLESVGWKEGWELYRAKYHELEQLKVRLNGEMADLKSGIEALMNKETIDYDPEAS